MQPKAKSLVFIGLLLAACPMLTGAATATLSGTVQDVAEESVDNGIAGVRIKVQDASGKEIASSLTDAKGGYRIELPTPVTGLTAFYEKVGFRPRPKTRAVTNLKNEQKPVLMVREAAASAYYQAVATNFNASRAAASQEEIQERAYAVAALPTADKSRVMAELKKFGGDKVLKDIQVAEDAQRLSSKVQARLSADQELGGRPIRVQFDPMLTGHLRLEGAVNHAGEKTKAEKIAKSVEGVMQIKNDIVIRK